VIIRDAIERASNEPEIFFLLAAYVETARHGDRQRTPENSRCGNPADILVQVGR
jgi:predicted DNA-binding protein